MPPEDKTPPRPNMQQERILREFASANAVTTQQAMDAMLALGARALADGTASQFTPGQAHQMELQAHEVSHVVQQRGGGRR